MRATKRQDLDVVLLGSNMADVVKAPFAALLAPLLAGGGAGTAAGTTADRKSVV